MNSSQSGWREHRRQFGAASWVFLLTLAPTLIVFFQLKENLSEQGQIRFDQAVRVRQEDIERDFQDLLDELTGLRGFCAASDHINRDEWQQYLRSIDLQRQFPGIEAAGYAERVEARQLPLHIRQVRESGLADYTVSAQTGRETYFPVGFLAEFDTGSGLRLGTDLAATEPARALLAEAAADNQARLAPRRVFFPGDATNGASFVLALPVYQRGAVVETDGQRPAALQGHVFGIFSMERALRPVAPSQWERHMHLEFYDGIGIRAAQLLHATRKEVVSEDEEQPLFSRVVTLPLANRVFTARFYATEEFISHSDKLIPWFALAGGLVISVLLAGITWTQARARGIAESLSRDLRREQERHHLVERATHDAVWDWDTVTGRLTWNEAAQEMFRCPPEQIRPDIQWWEERVHPEDRARVLDGLKASLASQSEFWADEYRFRRGDGTYADVLDRGYVLRDENQKPVRMVGSMMDITERRQAESARRQSEQKLALHVQQTPLAVIEWNSNFEVAEWNPGAERIFGYTAAEAVGRKGLELIVPRAAWPHVERVWQELINPENLNRTVEERYSAAGRRSTNENLTKDGRAIICDWSNTPLVDTGGKVAGVVSLAADITHRVRAERALADEKDRLAVTLRSIGDGVITTDTSGRVVLMSKAAEDLTGWKQAVALGQPLEKVFRVVSSKSNEPLDDPVGRALETGRIIALPANSLLVSSSGASRTIASNAAPIFNKDGRIVGAVLVFRDMTEQQLMAEELLRASKLDSLGLLAGGLAHDFNNILTAIVGNLSLARLHTSPQDKVLPRLEEAEKAAMRARHLTLQLLTFAKGGAPVRQTTSIGDLIRESVEFAVHGTSIRCEYALAADLWATEVDEGQISQVINNLALNAVQSMPEGGVIQIAAENIRMDASLGLPLPAGRYVRVSVRDHGTGIRPEHLPKIFDPYFTTKQTGSGLGLATSYSIIKKHDGLLTVESTLGAGSTFHIYLPASFKPPVSAASASREVPRGAGRLLVMDDEPLIRELAASALASLGYEVESAPDGAETIRLYSEARAAGRPFNAVLMDLTIPGGLGGRETIRKLLEIDPDVKGIVSSGYSNDPIMANYREHGFAGVVAKPYRVEDLAKVIADVTGNDSTGQAA